ncbi:MAG TPA: sigma-70 family RNA polymerase sigma factor [Acidimicrobiales bacterium]|jgi:RNA polymerase sigma-70 factor (ECF subfamily)|nr:sigma-70 family RNA polymerase sigma factor [Acidimicrobiales bacterium]
MSDVRVDEGYDEVFRAEHGSIVRTAFLVTGDRETAREVAQEAFAELYVRWAKVSAYDRPGAWLRRVAIRKAVRTRRRGARRAELEAGSAAGDRVATAADDTGDTGLDVLASLQELSPTQRAAVVLHYFDDLPVAEVAEALGCKPATASVHLHRARTRLAELLGEQEVDTDVAG